MEKIDGFGTGSNPQIPQEGSTGETPAGVPTVPETTNGDDDFVVSTSQDSPAVGEQSPASPTTESNITPPIDSATTEAPTIPDTSSAERKMDSLTTQDTDTDPLGSEEHDKPNLEQKVEQTGAHMLQERLDSKIAALQTKNTELQGQIDKNNTEIEHLQAAKEVDPEVAATIVHIASEAPLDQAA